MIEIIKQRIIPETPVANRRLGRHVNHDSRSLRYLVVPTRKVATTNWTRRIPILDQGNLGSCTGNAAVGILGSDPLFETMPGTVTLDENEAVKIYSEATELDDYPGTYPPDDTGSDGLSVAKAAKNFGLINGYMHITSLDAAKSAIQSGPFITGFRWYSSMDNPDKTGRVTVSGSIRGGHEVEVLNYDATLDLWQLVNSWGPSWGDQGHFYLTSDDYSRLLHEDGDATTFIPITLPSPVPVPIPTDDQNLINFHNLTIAWAKARHCGSNKKAAKAAMDLFKAEGLELY